MERIMILKRITISFLLLTLLLTNMIANEKYSGKIGDVITIDLIPQTNSNHPDLLKSSCKWYVFRGNSSAISLIYLQDRADVTILSYFSETITICCQYQIWNSKALSGLYEYKYAYFDIKCLSEDPNNGESGGNGGGNNSEDDNSGGDDGGGNSGGSTLSELTLSAFPSGGTVYKGKKVILTASDDAASIIYTLDGSNPHSSNTRKTISSGGEVIINESCTLKAYAQYNRNSEDYTWYYTVVDSGDQAPSPSKSIEINETNFPDATLRSELMFWYYGKDGVITPEEAKQLKQLNVEGRGIKDLKGIEFFPNLDALYCYDNQLISLDVSNNPALTTLSCGNNQLTSLDVSNNKKLKHLICYDNQLTSLDVSNNPALTNLWCCGNNIKGTQMDYLISSLPINFTNEIYMFRVVDPTSSNTDNVCTTIQVEAVKDRGWEPYCWDNNNGWVEYLGSDPTGINGVLINKDKGEPIYDLFGKKLFKPSKGINIIGGKKIVVK